MSLVGLVQPRAANYDSSESMDVMALGNGRGRNRVLSKVSIS